jgi:hypothetical protein
VGSDSRRKVDTAVKFRVRAFYVPSGTSTLELENHNLARGDKVSVIKSLTQEWVRAMPFRDEDGNTHYWEAKCSKQSTASAPCYEDDEIIVWERTVENVQGSRITLDVPISDNLDPAYGWAWVARNNEARMRTFNVGVVGLTASAGNTYLKLENFKRGDENSNYFLTMNNVQNAWASDLIVQDFNTAVFLDYGARFVTVKSVTATSKVGWTGKGARPLEFVTRGQQTLMRDCSSKVAGTYSFVTKQRAAGPNVFSKISAVRGSPPQPHMHWATGLLIDSASGAAPNFINRIVLDGVNGGHGWAVGYSIIWNGNFQGPPNSGGDQRGYRIELEMPPQGNNMVTGAKADLGKVFCNSFGRQDCTTGWAEIGNNPDPPSLYDWQVNYAKQKAG